MPFQVLRIKKCKGGAIAAAVKHNTRESPPAHCDPAKSHLNRELIGGNDPTLLTYKQIKQRMNELINTCPRKIRVDQVKCVELLLSASADFFVPDERDQDGQNDNHVEHDWDEQRLQQWTKHSLDFIHNELGPRAISATLHLDELTPHIHVLVVPIHDWDKRNLSCKGLFGNRQGFSQWQDKYQRYMKPIGLERGEKGSLANYQSVRQYHKKWSTIASGRIISIYGKHDLTRKRKFSMSSRLRLRGCNNSYMIRRNTSNTLSNNSYERIGNLT